MAVNPDSIPRYPLPAEPDAPTRTCGLCAHYCDVQVVRNPGCGAIGSSMGVPVRGELREFVGLCCVERDGGDLAGEVWQADPDDEPCADWAAAT